jgi:antirestriction protein ArdC
MPPRSAFVGSATSDPAEAYYATLLHELTHNAAIRIMPRLLGRAQLAV